MSIDVSAGDTYHLDGVTTTSSSGSTADRLQQKALGQDEFFKLLTAQLASQDPLEPMEDTAFIAQMASFSQLEMTSELTNSFTEFTSVQQFAAAQGYIGKEVSLSTGEEGIVTSIERQDGTNIIFLDGKVTDGRDVNTVYRVAEPDVEDTGDSASEDSASEDGASDAGEEETTD